MATGVTEPVSVEEVGVMDAGDHNTNLKESTSVDRQIALEGPNVMEFGEKVLFRLAVFATNNLIDDAAMLAFMFC